MNCQTSRSARDFNLDRTLRFRMLNSINLTKFCLICYSFTLVLIHLIWLFLIWYFELSSNNAILYFPEIKKLGEIGKDEIRSSSIFNDAEPSSFVFDNLETHKTSLSFQMGTGKAASSSFEVTVLGLTGKVKLLETELEETMAILKSKESRVAELESSINTRNSHKEEVRETDEEFERFFRQRIEAEIEYLAITRAIEKLQCETIIDGEKHVFADEQVEMMNRPKEAESKATTLKKQSCDDVSETKEVSTTRWEVFKVSSCAFVQLILLFLVLWLFVLQMPSPAGLDVPT